MFVYNFKLAWRSLRDKPALTALMVAAIALGLGVFMTVKTMAYQSQQLPVAHKSQQLFMTQLDNRETEADELPHQLRLGGLTYRDATNLMAANTPASQQTMTWKTEGILNTVDGDLQPLRARGLVGLNNFFEMFDAPFLFGNSWSASADTSGEAVIVLSKKANDHLFGGINSVGQQVTLNTHHMTVVGVMDDWHLSNRVYDGSFRRGSPDMIFIPHRFAINNNMPREVWLRCWASERSQVSAFYNSDLQGLMNSECRWITLWSENHSDVQAADYRAFLDQYIDSQQELGRFPRDNISYATDIVGLMTILNSLGQTDKTFALIAELFFAVCLINAVGILLAKFMRRTKEVSLRRALGAKKGTIMQQHLMEVSLIGLLGGIVGTCLAWLGLQGMLRVRIYQSDYNLNMDELAYAYQLDFPMIFMAFGVAIGSAIIVGLYPIWRVCNIPPASQLKSQ